jgi:hypothetical protein
MRPQSIQGIDLVNYRSHAITRELGHSFNSDAPWRCDQIQFSSRDLKSVKNMIDLRIRRRMHRRS